LAGRANAAGPFDGDRLVGLRSRSEGLKTYPFELGLKEQMSMQKLGNLVIDPAKSYFRVKLNWYCELVLPMNPDSYKLIEGMNGGGLQVVDFNGSYKPERAVSERVKARADDLNVQVVTGKFLIAAMENELVYQAEQDEEARQKKAELDAAALPTPANDD
jgi:hypothetical protein